jgi:hypothetical protein
MVFLKDSRCYVIHSPVVIVWEVTLLIIVVTQFPIYRSLIIHSVVISSTDHWDIPAELMNSWSQKTLGTCSLSYWQESIVKASRRSSERVVGQDFWGFTLTHRSPQWKSKFSCSPKKAMILAKPCRTKQMISLIDDNTAKSSRQIFELTKDPKHTAVWVQNILHVLQFHCEYLQLTFLAMDFASTAHKF